MNIIKEIRNYVKSKAREISPRINESQNPHNDNTVGQMKLDRSYFLRFVNAPVTPGQGNHSYTFNVEIELIGKGGANANEVHDKVLCDAVGLSATLVNKESYSNKFNSVTINNINTDPIEGNERFTKVTISASFLAIIKDGLS